MKIYFDVKNQIITRTDRNQVIANSADYLEAEITFSAEWATMEKTMTFKNGNLLYTYVLVNNKILEENHLNLGVGTWKVSIQGVYEDKKIVTNECNLAVNASGWIGSEALPPESIWNQLLVIIQSLHTEVASTAALRSAVQKYIEDNYDALVKEAVIVDDVRAALDDMAEDGTLSDLLAPLVAAGMPEVVADQISAVVAAQIGGVVANQIGAVVASQITTPVNQAVKNYCDDNFSGWSGALDRGLTQPLMAAPADMVGEIKSALSDIEVQVNDQVLNRFDLSKITNGKKTYFAMGYKITNLRDQVYSKLSEIIPCNEGDVITVMGLYAGSGTGPSDRFGIVFADENDNIIAYTMQPHENKSEAYSATAPSGAVCFRFNVNYNYSDVSNSWCTINKGTLDYAVPYGNFEVHRASENFFGGVKASASESSDTQEVKINTSDGKLYVNLHPSSEEHRILCLPTKVYMPKTNKPKVWYRSISWVRNIDSVYFKYPTGDTSTNQALTYYLKMNDGTSASRKYSESPSVLMYDCARETRIESKQFTSCMLSLADLTNPESTKNLLVIGDSFINNSVIPDRIKAKLTEYGLTNVNMIGLRQTPDGTKHEGHGGHAYYDYITNPADLESGHVNPFWHNGSDDFAWYASQCGVSTIDYVIIHLGINDLLDGTSADTIVTQMTTFIGYIHADFPDAIVIVDGLVIPSLDATQYFRPYDQMLKIHQYNTIMESGANAISNTYFAPVNFFFDSEHAYPYQMVAPEEGSTELVKVLTDSLHPYTPGYYQIADEALWALLYNSSDF